MEPASILWFTHFMALNNTGLTPSVSPSDLLPGKAECIEFWGPKSNHGHTFDNQDNPAYEIYVKELYTRVLQLIWPISGVMPFHFARGLVAEASGLDINWAEFAFKSTHPHHSHSKIPRVLPHFAELTVSFELFCICIVYRLHCFSTVLFSIWQDSRLKSFHANTHQMFVITLLLIFQAPLDPLPKVLPFDLTEVCFIWLCPPLFSRASRLLLNVGAVCCSIVLCLCLCTLPCSIVLCVSCISVCCSIVLVCCSMSFIAK